MVYAWKTKNLDGVLKVKEYPIINEFNIDPLFILRIQALLRHEKNDIETPSCTKRDIQNLIYEYEEKYEFKHIQTEFNMDWRQAANALKDCLTNYLPAFGVYLL